MVLWDALEPVGCDVHSSGNSLVRDAFMKIMRPGLDYRQTFTAFADKRLPRDMDPEERKRRQDRIGLTKEQLGQLLRDMGVAMKPTEMRTLVDAFDADGDGTVTLQEFLDFTGPKREKKGGAMAALGQRCCWKTTCRVTGMSSTHPTKIPQCTIAICSVDTFPLTHPLNPLYNNITPGMPNAFAYSELTAKAARDIDRGEGPGTAAGSIISASGVRREQRSKMNADASTSESKDNTGEGEVENNNQNLRGSVEGFSNTGSATGGMEIVVMKNGEKRMCMEHKERSKRYDMLVALMGRTISDRGGLRKGASQGQGPSLRTIAEALEEEKYNDSFDEDGKDNEERKEEGKERGGSIATMGGSRCAVGTWTNAQRREGAKFLNELTAEAQQEDVLRAMVCHITVYRHTLPSLHLIEPTPSTPLITNQTTHPFHQPLSPDERRVSSCCSSSLGWFSCPSRSSPGGISGRATTGTYSIVYRAKGVLGTCQVRRPRFLLFSRVRGGSGGGSAWRHQSIGPLQRDLS